MLIRARNISCPLSNAGLLAEELGGRYLALGVQHCARPGPAVSSIDKMQLTRLLGAVVVAAPLRVGRRPSLAAQLAA